MPRFFWADVTIAALILAIFAIQIGSFAYDMAQPFDCDRFFFGIIGCPKNWQQIWTGLFAIMAASIAFTAVMVQIAHQRATELRAMRFRALACRASLVGSLSAICQLVLYREKTLDSIRTRFAALRAKPNEAAAFLRTEFSEHRRGFFEIPIPMPLDEWNDDLGLMGVASVEKIARLLEEIRDLNRFITGGTMALTNIQPNAVAPLEFDTIIAVLKQARERIEAIAEKLASVDL